MVNRPAAYNHGVADLQKPPHWLGAFQLAVLILAGYAGGTVLPRWKGYVCTALQEACSGMESTSSTSTMDTRWQRSQQEPLGSASAA